MQSLSSAQARRITLAAQGFLDTPHSSPTMGTLARTVRRTGVLQVDSVNVLQRAHFMPLYSRMGAYDTELLRRASTGRQQRRLVEYWAHVQALMPVDLWPEMQHRMEQYRPQRGKWWTDGVTDDLVASLVAEIGERGASTARELDDGLPREKKHWGWNWSASRKALDFMFVVGDLAIAGRNSQFEVLYDLPERVLPDRVLARPTPTPEVAHRELVRRAAISHGVGTEQDLRDYYRMKPAESKPAVAALVEDGELVPVAVEGWTRPGYLHRDARLPRRVHARALLSPFDPLVWERTRAEQLFGFRYRIEIYVPEHLREYGYYVLPFLLGDRIVARVDLKADRRAGVLAVKAAYAEEHAPAETADELALELAELAGWLGLGSITVAGRGDLSAALRSAVRSAA
ncbi:winged helix-turn-helix domain-containing protein [Nocardioides marmorisolisilvae]|uniref:Winged helix-turn-helix domain-containing protein n=1 Tax=Nocardioides marmorisolisilvae TaxID=1542737 RepID=A0A3N0DSM7_9ACTN|nr:crosslink repair DNA glycosylase YcaQ family protein [Nocardioides marmorisolisilvae]RNL78647.1 winged helix-turn-helix domain-containing protein [Nocardioides marmorisolisilvae]